MARLKWFVQRTVLWSNRRGKEKRTFNFVFLWWNSQRESCDEEKGYLDFPFDVSTGQMMKRKVKKISDRSTRSMNWFQCFFYTLKDFVFRQNSAWKDLEKVFENSCSRIKTKSHRIEFFRRFDVNRRSRTLTRWKLTEDFGTSPSTVSNKCLGNGFDDGVSWKSTSKNWMKLELNESEAKCRTDLLIIFDDLK